MDSTLTRPQKARDRIRRAKVWYFGMKLHIGVDVVSHAPLGPLSKGDSRDWHRQTACKGAWVAYAPLTLRRRGKHVWRCALVLATAEGLGTMEVMRRTGKGKVTVWRWQDRYVEAGVEGLLRDRTRPPGQPPTCEEKVQASPLPARRRCRRC